MKRFLCLLGLSLLCSTLALAGNWTGSLLDSDCYTKSKKADSCVATSATANFALMDSSGKLYKLDAKGNTLAATAIKNRADRAADPANPHAATVSATIVGAEKSGTIEVQSIDIR